MRGANGAGASGPTAERLVDDPGALGEVVVARLVPPAKRGLLEEVQPYAAVAVPGPAFEDEPLAFDAIEVGAQVAMVRQYDVGAAALRPEPQPHGRFPPDPLRCPTW